MAPGAGTQGSRGLQFPWLPAPAEPTRETKTRFLLPQNRQGDLSLAPAPGL